MNIPVENITPEEIYLTLDANNRPEQAQEQRLWIERNQDYRSNDKRRPIIRSNGAGER